MQILHECRQVNECRLQFLQDNMRGHENSISLK